ncbi:MAG: DUF4129 domain-containing protein, partial [bacterium]
SGAFPWYDSKTEKYAYSPPPPPSWLERLYNWLDGWFPEVKRPSVDLNFDWATILIWALVIAVLVFMVYQLGLVMKEWYESRKPASAPKQSGAQIELAEIAGDLELETATPDQIWALACRMKQQDEVQRAISLAWLAIVRRFGARHNLHDPSSLTPRQWGREAKRIHPMLQLEKLVGFYEIVIFGNRRPGRSAFENWWAGAERVYGKMEWGESR